MLFCYCLIGKNRRPLMYGLHAGEIKADLRIITAKAPGHPGAFPVAAKIQNNPRRFTPDKLESANLLNRIPQMNIKRSNQQFLQIFIVVFEKEFYSLAIVFFCVKLPA